MDLTNFYQEKDRLSYNPVNNLSTPRNGLKRLISFDDRFVTVSSYFEELIKKTRKEKAKVLDIGVGDAVYERMISPEVSKKSEFYGIDISKKQLERSKKFLKETKIIDLNIQELPYKNDFFDIVLVSEILEHLFQPDFVLSEAIRTLKKDGYLILTYPNSGSIQLRLSLFFAGYSPLLNYPRNKEHIRFFNRSDILKMLKIKPKVVLYQGLGSFLFGKWNFPIKIITPRLLQVFGNEFLPNLALGNLLILKK